jgi:hypothetical protein
MSAADVLQAITQIDDSIPSAFSAAQILTQELRNEELSTGAKLDLVIRFLDKGQRLANERNGLGAVIASICRDVGLYPYAQSENYLSEIYSHMPTICRLD